MYKIGVIGGGNMGEAIIASSLKHFFVYVSEKDPGRQRYLQQNYKLSCRSIKELVQACEIIVLAVKPQDIDEVLKEVRKFLNKDKLVISIAAGITINFFERNLGGKPRVVRTMPNLPALIGQGITAVAKGKYAKKSDVELAGKIFNNLGHTVSVKEELIDAITAVSGSGPAYVSLFMEYMIKAAQSLGLKEDLAADLVKSTFAGSINLLLKKNISPGELRVKVTSKGGTTQAALDVFAKNNLDKIITKALQAAKKKARKLSRK